MGIDAILAIAGLIVPPVANFVNKKFLKREQDTPEATVNTLATTKPEQVAPYIQAMTGWYETLIKWFNRDVIGTPSQWVVDLRAAIRPISVIASLLVIALDNIAGMGLDPATRGALLGNIASWFSSRLPTA